MHPRLRGGRTALSWFHTLSHGGKKSLLLQACVLRSGKSAQGHRCIIKAVLNTSFLSPWAPAPKGAVVCAFLESSAQERNPFKEFRFSYTVELTFRHMDFSGVCLLLEEQNFPELPLAEREWASLLFQNLKLSGHWQNTVAIKFHAKKLLSTWKY